MGARLEDKTAIITGAAAGQGKAAAELFSEEGARLAITDVNESGLAETAEAVAASGEVLSEAGDLADPEFVSHFAGLVNDRYGSLDVLYNNAGILGPCKPVTEFTVDEWDYVQRVNARSQFLMIRDTLPVMRQAPGGSIINVSSVAALRGSRHLALYASSKAAIVGLTRALAAELGGENIRVNAILPSSIDTDMPRAYLESIPEAQRPTIEDRYARHLIRRLGTSDEVARVALFLASDEASFLTGMALPVDAGRMAW
jgi:NAD(P)-dependent dehydrogenase (short-subunit alcohol dehydrogenase family)